MQQLTCFAGTGNGTAKGLYGNTDVVTAALHIIRGQCIIQPSKTIDVHSIILLILQDSTELRKFISHKSCIKLTQMYELFVGKTNRNNVQAVYSGGKLASFSTIVIGCGLFSDLIYHTERQRWLKKARYVGEIKFTNCDFVT